LRREWFRDPHAQASAAATQSRTTRAKEARMGRIGLAFLIGHCCVYSLAELPDAWPAAALLAAALAVAVWVRQFVLVALLCGSGLAWFHGQARLEHDLSTSLEGRDILVVGRIASILDTRALDPQFEFDVEHADHQVPPRVRLSWYDAEVTPGAGERWQFVVRLKRRNGFANPGGFDYEGYLFRAGIGATGYIRTDSRNMKLAEAGAAYPILQARAWLSQRIAEAVGETSMLGILQGLAVGDTQAMQPEQWRVFAATGTSHLMAISGLHISMVAALAAFAGGLVVRWPRAQALQLSAVQGQAIAGIGAAFGYSLLAGMSVPTQRTLLMLCLYFAARWARRSVSIGHALGSALIGVLLIDPFAPLSVGAWLSFGAVAIIVVATSGRLRPDTKVRGFVRVQWAVTLGLLPILAIAFGSLSLISPLANAIAIPLFTLLIVPLVLIGTGVAGLSIDIGGGILKLAAWLLEQSWPALAWLADRPLAMWYFPELPVAHHVMLAFGAILLVLPGAVPMRVAAITMCLPALLYRPAAPELGSFELTMLDVGQGLAMVVRTHTHTLVYDAGPAFNSGRDTGELVVVPFLRSRGVRAVDRLVVSHGDLDHAGGLGSIVRQVRTHDVLAGRSVDSPYVTSRCELGQRWIWDEVTFEILHPAANSSPRSDNDSSCVLKIAGRHGTALLTGDIEADAESAIVRSGLPRADIVGVPHHGSRSSSTPDFIAATQARLALVSAGYRNRWGFPKDDVVERWQAAGAQVVSTIPSGAIDVTVSRDGSIGVRHYRQEHRRFWSSR
jgi:competence protein ComEC